MTAANMPCIVIKEPHGPLEGFSVLFGGPCAFSKYQLNDISYRPLRLNLNPKKAKWLRQSSLRPLGVGQHTDIE